MSDFTDKLRPARPSGPSTLAKERAKSAIKVQELSGHLFARNNFLERQDRVLKEMKKEKLLSKRTQLNLARPDRYKLGLARAKLLRRMADRLKWDDEDYKMAEYLTDEMSPYFLTRSMFETTIKEQGSDEQQAYWLPLIGKWKIYGSYAQTELGHGSNVRGIELEARWDNESKEFILHSPTLTASKWWNGSLGRTATHAIVVAQLLLPENGQYGSSGDLKYKSFGPKPFVVRVRDPKTHKPHPGVVIGDIGPKYGYTSMDNAYMLFDNFRVPHSAFLSRYFQVDKNNGSYTSTAQNPAVVYGSLTNVRVNIIMHARLILARAVTIAVRYLTIRRQFHDRDESSTASGPEMAVLDYPTVQIRVLPLLASTFALHYGGLAMGEKYAQARRGIDSGDFSKLSDLHATSSGLKSVCTILAADGIEVCRRACGGHGFGGPSGFIPLNNDYLSKPTVEGDNWMITQQTASYLIKRVSAVLEQRRKPTASTSSTSTTDTERAIAQYLSDREAGRTYTPSEGAFTIYNTDGDSENDSDIVAAFERRAAHLALAAHKAREVDHRPWTRLLVQLHHLSNAHSQAILVRNFHSAISSASSAAGHGDQVKATMPPQSAKGVMRICFRLFALHTMNQHAREFSTCGAVSDADLDNLPDAILRLMEELRPHAVALVDAWAIPDYLLDSALGRYDGRVYEDLFQRAHRENPLNEETFNPYYWDEEIVMGSKDGGRDVLSKL